MQLFTENRTLETPDEIWIVEHPPVYTLGLNGKREHLLNPGSIPIIKSDRGGQVTFHGPGQLVIYTLLDIKRLKLGVRPLVTLLEQAIIDTLAQYGVSSEARPDAPGVYLDKKKIASIGLRIKKGCSFHGLSINNHMDLTPFEHINTCGYRELEVTQLADQGVIIDNLELAVPLLHAINTTLQT
jgi:lipoyl(octanoyl) transferase